MSSELKFSVGYQLPDRYSFAEVVKEYAASISEVYFPWLDIPDGRGMSISNFSDKQQMENELREIRALDIKLNLLLNANCYGRLAVSEELERHVCQTIEYLSDTIDLGVVTTTSLFIAKVVKKQFPHIETRASVNMAIGSVAGMKYVKDYFDSYYIQRELNRMPSRIRSLREWCDNNGKGLYLLANSGCLRNCSAHTFHDNLVSHECELNMSSNRWPEFRGVCWEYYSDPANHSSFLSDTTWIRPEDISIYKELVNGIKLATRSHSNPGMVIDGYVNAEFDGNTLSLCEPDFSALAHVDNTAFPPRWMKPMEKMSERQLNVYCKEIWNNVNR